MTSLHVSLRALHEVVRCWRKLQVPVPLVRACMAVMLWVGTNIPLHCMGQCIGADSQESLRADFRVQGFSLNGLKHLVLDEADRLLNMDFEAEIDQILRVIPRERRTQLFSATMTSKVALQRHMLLG